MGDLKNPNVIVFKGVLFLALGVMSSVFLIVSVPSFKVAVLLAISIWSFCRFYYFAFYVIENYIDSSYKFSGLYSAITYLMQKRCQRESEFSDDGGDSD